MDTPSKTDFLDKNSFETQLLDIINDLESKYNKIKISCNEKGNVFDKFSYHFINDLLKPTNRLENAFYKHLMNICYKSEILSQGSSVIAFLFALKLARKQLSQYSEKKKLNDFNHFFEHLKDFITKHQRQVSSQEFETIIKDSSSGSDEILNKVAYEAVNLAGLEGKIFIENGLQKNFIIEQKDGYTFKVNPYKFFLKDNKFWERSQVKVLLFDGLLENVSEIDQILQKSFETKQPLLILAHGYSEEVVSTLKVNQDAGNIDAMPIRIIQDLENINTINDLSTVCGGEPVSSMNFRMLATIAYDELPLVPRIKIAGQEMVIENDKTKASVNQQIKFLLQKRNDQSQIEDVQVLLDKRLKTLVSNSVIITLPNVDQFTNDSLRVKLDNQLRFIKSILNYGILNTELISNFTDNNNKIFVDCLHETINDLNKKELPALSILSGILQAGNMISLFIDSSGFVHLI